VAYATAARSIQYTTRRTLTPLQRAILDEYATWYAYGREAELALMRPLVEERGWDSVPDALRLVKETTTMSAFLERWARLPAEQADASPEGAAAYFGALFNIEREALRLGRKETFLMLQDARWRDRQARYFSLAQKDPSLIPDEPVLVRWAQVAGDRARVQLVEPLPSLDGLPPQSLGGTAYLRQQDGGWRHANVLEGYSWPFAPPLALTGTPTPAPTQTSTPTPTRVAGRGSD
jgi:hypothetical protein